jgi:hypothetical protein
MANLFAGLISLAIGVIILANVFIATVNDTNTTGWDTADIALWGTLSLVAIAGMVYGVAAVFGLV